MKKIILTSVIFVCFASIAFAQAPALKITADGDVGIGTATPSQSLELVGNFQMQNNAFFVTRRNDNSPHTVFGQDAFNDFVFNFSAVTTGASSSTILGFGGASKVFDIRFNDGGGQLNRLRVLDNGRVGIGTTSPNALLHVNGDIHNAGGVVTSDKKLKSDIRSFDYGLDAILKIEPVFFKYNGKADIVSDRTHVGVIAQDMRKVIPEIVEEWEFVKHDVANQNKVLKREDYLAVQSDAIQYVLVNAIKQQQGMIDALQKDNEEMRQKLDEVLTMLADNDEKITRESLDGTGLAYLKQNTPNPFESTTNVEYFVPEGTTAAAIVITANNGQVIKEISINHMGQGKINLSAQNIPAGIYRYSLHLDGKVIDTKTMSLMR